MKDIGFVYEWLDLSNGKKYIGSHKGTPDDGYTGSGKIFKNKYNARPDDFYRFIRYCGPNYREAEELLLNSVDAMHNDEYYNLKNSSIGFDSETAKKAAKKGARNGGKIGGKISGKINGRKNVESGHLNRIRKKSLEVCSIAILVYRKDTGEFVGEFKSQSEAARELKSLTNAKVVAVNNINTVLKGRKKSAGGYTFKYKNSDS